MLSNEISLSEQFGVSRMTVRQALTHLTHEGLLTRHRAKGTFVAPPLQQVPFVLDRLRSR
jgi:GntR family transcriptional regulator